MKTILYSVLLSIAISASFYSQVKYDYEFAPEKWSVPEPVAELKNIYANEPFISSDGKKLFISAARYVEKTDTGWSEVKALSGNVDRNLVRNVCIMPDSKRLFFTWWYYGGWDLFYSEWDSLKQDWGAAKWGGYELNDGGYEQGCTFPNDTTIIFLRDERTHISYLDRKTGKWSEAQHWPKYQNRMGSYYGIHVTPDMKKVYATNLNARIVPPEQSVLSFDITVKYRDTTLDVNGNGYSDFPMLLNLTLYSDSMSFAGKFAATYEGQPCLTPDGKTMYFTANYPNLEEERIYVSHMLIDENGNPVTAVKENTGKGTVLPEESLMMYPPYPNPFNPETTVKYTLSREMKIKATLYDISGERVRELKEGIDTPGEHTLRVITDGLSSGIYLIHLQSPYQSLIEKAVVVK